MTPAGAGGHLGCSSRLCFCIGYAIWIICRKLYFARHVKSNLSVGYSDGCTKFNSVIISASIGFSNVYIDINNYISIREVKLISKWVAMVVMVTALWSIVAVLLGITKMWGQGWLRCLFFPISETVIVTVNNLWHYFVPYLNWYDTEHYTYMLHSLFQSTYQLLPNGYVALVAIAGISTIFGLTHCDSFTDQVPAGFICRYRWWSRRRPPQDVPINRNVPMYSIIAWVYSSSSGGLHASCQIWTLIQVSQFAFDYFVSGIYGYCIFVWWRNLEHDLYYLYYGIMERIFHDFFICFLF